MNSFLGGGTALSCEPATTTPPHRVGAKHNTKQPAVKTKINLRVLTADFLLCVFSCSHPMWLAGVGNRSHWTHRGGSGIVVYISSKCSYSGNLAEIQHHWHWRSERLNSFDRQISRDDNYQLSPLHFQF